MAIQDQPNSQPDPQKAIPLKLDEPVVDPDTPWADDLLDRQNIAAKLTNLVSTQEPPLTVSLHGHWGTGKTFLLRRWQKALSLDKYQAIYFNAWEDDFCDDPFLAMIGQLSDHFKDGKFKALARKAVEIAIPLIRENLLGALKATTGLTIKPDNQQGNTSPLDAYLEQRGTKDSFKNQLGRLAEEVARETGHPVVFIVDELDRCRPTFAIELLERVKHIFDVPNLVFVFGINRDEICKSLASVYGEINTDVYLRRFFDFEFNLREVDSRRFAEKLIDRFQLAQVFQKFDETLANSGQRHGYSLFKHTYDYDNYKRILPGLWSALGFSLRDIDYGIRLLALLTRNMSPGTFTHPFLLAILIAMKFKNAKFYRALTTGNFRTSEIMNYVDDEVSVDPSDTDLMTTLDRSEGFLYCADNANHPRRDRGESALAELNKVQAGNAISEFQVISRRAQNGDQRQRANIARAIEDGRVLEITGAVLGTLAALIDTYQSEVRR